MTSNKIFHVILMSLAILVGIAGCNADNDQGIDSNQGTSDQPETPGETPNLDPDMGMEGGANEGFDAQDFRPLYRRQDADKRGERFSSFNRQGPNNRNDLDSRRMRDESSALSSPIGFAEYSANSSEASFRGFGSQTYTVDRQLLAELIGQVVAGLPDVEEASVLVTDQHCLIGYTANEESGRNVEQQITMAADSVAPGWYKVYTTNDPRLTDHIRQIAHQNDGNSNGNTDVKNLIREVDALVEQMGGPNRLETENKAVEPAENTDRFKSEFNRKTDNFHRKGNINQR